MLELSEIRPYRLWYTHYFEKKIVKINCYGGIFSIDKNDIIQNSVDFYNIFINQLNKSSNPEVGHYIERSWAAIFYPLIHTIKS